MTQKLIWTPNLIQSAVIGLLGLILAIFFLHATVSALSVDQVQQKYHISKSDAQQLISDVRDDVQQQCQGRTPGEMGQCVSSKTGPVLRQHANQCIDNKKLDENCSQRVTKQNNSPNQGGPAGQVDNSGCQGGDCGHQCGADDQNPYRPSIDLGCKAKGNPILDTLFGIIHFLTNGVGIIVVGSIIVGGIQYTGSRGNPQATALAVNRIRSSLFALLIFMFAYAAINFIIPGALLQ